MACLSTNPFPYLASLGQVYFQGRPYWIVVDAQNGVTCVYWHTGKKAKTFVQ